ncbi:MAG: fibrobacter succinogenes major paralogous domain-containing protein [Chitinophagaceae bacterium]|nr:fibrobacter succinogenes major paralogous domain-containing protein [Chitinophagaceae bacterium]
MDVSAFKNGDVIPEAKTNDEWREANKQKKPAWCYYNNNPENGKKYGKLYNGYAIVDKRGLAPDGWHIPSLDEMEVLRKFLGDSISGIKMKSKSGWEKKADKNLNGTNSAGFNGQPGGERDGSGEFLSIGTSGYWFFTDYEDGVFSDVDKDVGAYTLGYLDEFVGCGEDGGWEGYSVRCIKDKIVENKSKNKTSDKNPSFDGVWVADPNSRVIYDGNRITDITITKNGENYLFVFNKNDLSLKTMGTVDQSNNISLYGGQWLVALDVTDNDNLFLKGEIFHRVK